MTDALIVVAQNGYQDVELAGTRKGLMEKGFEIVLASTETGPCIGKFGGMEVASVALRDVNVHDYDRIAFIGGPGAHEFRDDDDAKRIARETIDANKPLGAICIAPTILATAGVLDGKRLTVWDDGKRTQISLIEEAGATFTDEPVTVDGLLVTGNGPEAAEEFGRALANV